MAAETIQSVTAQRNWLANRLSYMMSVPLAGTPMDIMTGWSMGPIVRPSPAEVVQMAKGMVEHGDNGYIYKARVRHKPLPTTIGD